MKSYFDLLLNAIAKNRTLGYGLVLLVSFLFFYSAHLTAPLLINEMENRTWDWRLSFVADKNQADKNIKLIIVDQSTLEFFEREYSLTWPFPRDIYKYIIDYLARAGAKGLAFDLLFTESSAQAVEGDLILAEASNGKLPVVHAVTLETSDRMLNQEKFTKFTERQKAANSLRHFADHYFKGGAGLNFTSATLPIPELIEKGQGFGSVSASSDSDGIFRRYSVGGVVNQVPVLSLPFELYDLVEGSKDYPIEQFLDENSRIAIRLHGPSGTYPSYSLKAIAQSEQQLQEGLKPIVDPAEFKDAWVLLGVWAPGLFDLRPTPLEERGKGVEFVAAVLDNIIHRDFVYTITAQDTLILTVIMVVLGAAIVFFISNPLWQVGILFSFAALFLGGSLYGAANAVWIPVFLPFSSTALAILLGLGLQFQVEGRQHRFVRGAFQYYVSKGVIDQIMGDPSRLQLGGEKRELTIFFSDIKGFTSISEKLEATQLVAFLNEYLTDLTDIILASGGTLDKYVGDAIVAFWNAPIDLPEHALTGVRAAIDCQKKLSSVRAKLKQQFGVEVYTRIGLHTGAVSVGNFGSKTRFNYTMIGDSANLASRLEGVNKKFGTSILVSNSTQKLIGNSVVMRKVADLRVVGKSEVVTVFQPLIEDPHLFEPKHLEQYYKGLELFEKGELNQAAQVFEELKGDPVASSYLERIREEQQHPSVPWSPVWNMTDK